MTNDARRYHERLEAKKKVLFDLRKGMRIIKTEYETDDYLGKSSRLAASVEQLRNAHGFNIDGEGTQKLPYELIDKDQWPKLIEVTEGIKSAYYESIHWLDIRQKRFEIDDFACIQCKEESSPLHCHHVTYKNLFDEDVDFDLQTLCESCHKHVHEKARIKFPSGLPIEQVKALGFEVVIDDWLIPPEPKKQNSNHKLIQNILPGFESTVNGY